MRLNPFICLSVILFATSCANVVPPTGGPVDPTPPAVINQYPAQGTVNFNGNKLIIEFDEFLAPIADPSSIIISPTPSKAPEISVRKKKITLHFSEPLKRGTTYTVNFGDNIKDNHEGNPLSNFTVVFSTGSFIDSGFISGAVIDARDLSTQKEITVILHADDHADSAVFSSKPDYVSKTDLNGFYSFRNLPSGSYKIYAVKDENKNLMLDHNELFAFNKKAISLEGDSIKQLQLRLSPFKKHEPIVITKNRRVNDVSYVFGFNQDISDSMISIVPSLQTGNQILESIKIEGDSVRFYYYPPVKSDSIQLNILAGNRIIQSYSYSYPKFPQAAFNLGVLKSVSRPMDTLIINSAQAIKNINKAKLSLTLNDSIKQSFEVMINPLNPFELYVLFDKKEGKNYTFNVPDSSIQSFYNNYNRRLKYTINISEEKRFGSINASIENESGKQLIIWLLDKEKRIVRAFYTKNTLVLHELWIVPGDYMLKVIWDKNGNNRFDLSDYENGIESEPVYIYPDNIVIKSNWEVSELRITPVFK
jgi:uncharacterized protein (DUF2141 family)